MTNPVPKHRTVCRRAGYAARRRTMKTELPRQDRGSSIIALAVGAAADLRRLPRTYATHF
jgi:hypothetical protein